MLTYDDFREAHLGAKSEKSKRSLGVIVGWVFFLGLAVVLFMFMRATSPAATGVAGAYERPRVAASRVARAGAAVVPAIGIGLLIGYFSVRSAKAAGAAKPWDPPQVQAAQQTVNVGRGVLGWVLFVGVATTIFMLLKNNALLQSRAAAGAPAAPDEPSLEMFDFMIGLLPVCMMFVAFLLVTRLAGDGPVRRSWDAQEALVRRRTTVEATASGIAFADDDSRQECQWSHFAGYKETPNLFILYPTALSLHMIPKRAFTEAGIDLMAFRSLLLSGIPTGYFLEQPPSAFPVVPLAARAAG